MLGLYWASYICAIQDVILPNFHSKLELHTKILHENSAIIRSFIKEGYLDANFVRAEVYQQQSNTLEANILVDH